MHPKHLSINDYSYHLPAEKIAAYPLQHRDHSKLLIYKNGHIREDNYFNLANYLSSDSLLILNDTRVIPARVLFSKPTGGIIEIFCLEPYPEIEYNSAMDRKGSSLWKCMIGGAGKWKSGILTKKLLIDRVEILLSVALITKLQDAYIAKFSWNPSSYSFAEILHLAGEVPLPPYIKRKAEIEDIERYQTIYAHYEGSVAAPTAGLHFTETILSSIKKKNITVKFGTLHVGAGTFKPVKTEIMEDHDMHAEWMDVTVDTIENLITHAGNITAVGTTSVRTLESLYWMGVKSAINPLLNSKDLQVSQWEVYDESIREFSITPKNALISLLKWMGNNKQERLIISTSILIAPGYRFRIINALITNFHQPRSTLLLLVAAGAGDNWRTIYDYALSHDFRFLSYGDGCLLFV